MEGKEEKIGGKGNGCESRGWGDVIRIRVG